MLKWLFLAVAVATVFFIGIFTFAHFAFFKRIRRSYEKDLDHYFGRFGNKPFGVHAGHGFDHF